MHFCDILTMHGEVEIAHAFEDAHAFAINLTVCLSSRNLSALEFHIISTLSYDLTSSVILLVVVNRRL